MTTKLRALSIFIAFLLSLLSVSPPAVAASILFVFALMALHSRESRRCAKLYVMPLLFILIVGVASVFLGSQRYPAAYLYFRDGFYFFLPVLALCAGIGVARDQYRLHCVLQGAVIAGVFITIITYFEFIVGFGVARGLSLDSRYEYGLDSNAALVTFLILWTFRSSSNAVISKKTDTIIILLSVLAIAASLSRTNILIALIVVILPLIHRPVGSKTIILAAFLGFMFVAFGAELLELGPKIGTSRNFVDKVAGSLSEIVVRDLYTVQDINEHWRAYEGFLGLEVFRSGDWLNYIFGQGFGSHASASSVYRDKFEIIPIFHFGYITVLLKSGWLGLILYFYFFYNILGRLDRSSGTHYIKQKNLLIKLLCIALILKTYFVMGVYTTKSQIFELVVLGALLRDFHLRSLQIFPLPLSDQVLERRARKAL